MSHSVDTDTQNTELDNQVETCKDLDENHASIFLSVLLNWETISKNKNVMTAVDMEKNSLCRSLKLQNPSYEDIYIQAHVLAALLMTIISVSRSLTTDETHPEFLNNKSIEVVDNFTTTEIESIKNEESIYFDLD